MIRPTWAGGAAVARLATTLLHLLCCAAFGGSAPSAPSSATDKVGDSETARTHRPRLRWVRTDGLPGRYEVEARPLPRAILAELAHAPALDRAVCRKWLRVYAVPPGTQPTETSLCMLGDYDLRDDRLRFTPAFDLSPGMWYLAVLDSPHSPEASGARLRTIKTLRIPAPRLPRSTVVTKIYPTGTALPENLLKFYLHFSAPMSRGQIYQHIHLRREGGRDVELPFLEIDEELWNPEMTRLTLFIDPGRIKRGVRPLEEIGPALEQGGRFELVIDQDWQDASGTPLKRSAAKRFTIGPADREPLDPRSWDIDAPRSGTRQPLRLWFNESLDEALLRHCLDVIDTEGHAVEGSVRIGPEERAWEFRPDHPWSGAEMAIRIRTTLEDLAGNNIGKAFDVDVFDRVPLPTRTPFLLVPFRPSDAKGSPAPGLRRHVFPARRG
ncbi:MAG: hypothetical protein JNN07_01710 [Verrucomicrobiales bacterium]|nr:hypothetical protein [Verrucomicrobiales bacterium]